MKRENIFRKGALVFVFAALLLFPHNLPAQDFSAPYLLPQTVFVGDRGRLVVPLGQAYLGVEPFVLDASRMLNDSPDLLIQRIELERRGGSSRLFIDFIPYAPGVLSIPPLDFYSLSPNLQMPSAEAEKIPALVNLRVQVASILNPSQMTLSNPAPPLAAPGTSFIVYGFLILILAILFLGICVSLWGRRNFSELWRSFRRRRLIRLMSKFLRRLKQESGLESEKKAAFYLSVLSGEFRRFLSLFTGVDCYSFSAEEFFDLSLGYEDSPVSPMLCADFLCSLFSSWDTLRFSGRLVEKSDLFHALSETDRVITALDKAEMERPIEKTILRSKSVRAAIAAGGEGL